MATPPTVGGQPGPRLPGLGNDGGRKRNTVANIYSKSQIDYKNPGGSAALPSLDPASTANYYDQLGQLYAQYQTTKLGLRQQRVGLKANFQTAKAGIQSEKLVGLEAAEQNATERGVLGSSGDLSARAGVRGSAQAALNVARTEKLTGIAETRLSGQQAALGFASGATQLESQKLASQQQLLAQQLERNLIISGQESQMDYLKQVYDALMASINGGGGGKLKGLPADTVMSLPQQQLAAIAAGRSPQQI